MSILKRLTVPDVAPLVQAYYSKPGNGVGGSLHIVLDDGNIEDSHVRFCRKHAETLNDIDGIRLCDLLLQMTKTQRRKLYDMKKTRA
ncbi:MAG: hypothetical protein Q8Q39_04375 [bacterium]|nr:hypothetical protein [bacterium]